MGERSREYQIEILGPESISRETASEVRIYYAVDGVCTLRRESGGVTLEKINRLSKLNADFISVGALTHSAGSRDINLTLVID